MKRSLSKLLVIDANVLMAAGGHHAKDARPAACANFLNAVQRICHRVVTTPQLTAEWRKPPRKREKGRSLKDFTRTWLYRMNGAKKVVPFQQMEDIVLRGKLRKADLKDNELEEALADFHLIEAALSADSRIMSCDEKARNLFRQIAVRVGELRALVWVNPEYDHETPIKWLEQGAPNESERRLGRTEESG